MPKIYANGGYAILGDESVHIVFDAGSLGYPSIAAHGHADALSICLAINGKWWLVDPGTYAYHSLPAWRNYFRGTFAHNTIQVDKEDQSQIAGPFLWLQHARAQITEVSLEPRMQTVTGTHDGYAARGVTHERRVSYSASDQAIKIRDSLIARGEHRVAICFHFAPGTHITRDAASTVVNVSQTDCKESLVMSLTDTCDWEIFEGAENPIAGWYSSALGKRAQAPVLVGSALLATGQTAYDTIVTFRTSR